MSPIAITTLETIVQEWQQVPPPHLESVYQLVHVLTVRQPAGDKTAAAERIRATAGALPTLRVV